MKKLLILFIMFLAAVSLLYRQYGAKPSPEIHLHAGFQVYQNNVLQDFSDFKYMNIKPCDEDDIAHDDPANEQNEKAHLHDKVGDVVHVHRANVVWQDLFTNLNVTINPTPSAFINGQPISDFLQTPIQAYDSLVIFEGENQAIETKLKTAVTKDHILEVEKRSETCGT